MEKVVRLRLEQKWSISSLMAKFKLSQSQISSISVHFRSSLINLKESSIEMRNSNKRILKDFHKEYNDRFVEAQYMNKITASNIKKKLGEQFKDLKSISKSTIIRWLKNLFKLFLQKDGKKAGTCSNSRIPGHGAGSSHH